MQGRNGYDWHHIFINIISIMVSKDSLFHDERAVTKFIGTKKPQGFVALRIRKSGEMKPLFFNQHAMDFCLLKILILSKADSAEQAPHFPHPALIIGAHA